MHSLARELEEACARWRDRGLPLPAVALVSGSGLAMDFPFPRVLREPLAPWLPFPSSEVAGHQHELELLELPGGRHLLSFRGRLHGYQGLTPAQVVFPVRWSGLLGVRTLLLTNAAGGLDPSWPAGTLVLLSDHLNLTGSNPLTGTLPAAWGPRFPDLSTAYDVGLRDRARRAAQALGIRLEQGVYAGVAGPSYETPAEVRMLRRLGADLVGMSTVHEVIAARHLGISCLAISLVANPAAGLHESPLRHEEVLAAARTATGTLAALLAKLLEDPTL